MSSSDVIDYEEYSEGDGSDLGKYDGEEEDDFYGYTTTVEFMDAEKFWRFIYTKILLQSINVFSYLLN